MYIYLSFYVSWIT